MLRLPAEDSFVQRQAALVGWRAVFGARRRRALGVDHVSARRSRGALRIRVSWLLNPPFRLCTCCSLFVDSCSVLLVYTLCRRSTVCVSLCEQNARACSSSVREASRTLSSDRVLPEAKPAHTREDGWGVTGHSLHQATRPAEASPAARTRYGCTAVPPIHRPRSPPAQLDLDRPGV